MNNWCIFCFSRKFLLWILIFKGLTARRLYKSFGVKALTKCIVLVYTICMLLFSPRCHFKGYRVVALKHARRRYLLLTPGAV
jgi:hypothetical protein